jgi:hypothetical protein
MSTRRGGGGSLCHSKGSGVEEPLVQLSLEASHSGSEGKEPQDESPAPSVSAWAFQTTVKSCMARNHELVLAGKDFMVMMKSLSASIIVFYFLDIHHMITCNPILDFTIHEKGNIVYKTIPQSMYRDVAKVCSPVLDYSTSKAVFTCLVCINQGTYAFLILCRYYKLFRHRSRVVATASAGFACVCAFAKVSIVVFYALGSASFSCSPQGTTTHSGGTECYTLKVVADLNNLLPGGCNATENAIPDGDGGCPQPNAAEIRFPNGLTSNNQWTAAKSGTSQSCCEPVVNCNSLCAQPNSTQTELILLAVSYILSGAYLIYMAIEYHTNCKEELNLPADRGASVASKLVRRVLGDIASLAKYFIALGLILGIVSDVDDSILSNVDVSLSSMSSCSSIDVGGNYLVSGSSISSACIPILPNGQLWYQGCSSILILLAGMYCASIIIEKGPALRVDAWRIVTLWLCVVLTANLCIIVLLFGVEHILSVEYLCSTALGTTYSCAWKNITATDLSSPVPFGTEISCNDQCSVALPDTMKILTGNLMFSALYFVGLVLKFAVESTSTPRASEKEAVLVSKNDE